MCFWIHDLCDKWREAIYAMHAYRGLGQPAWFLRSRLLRRLQRGESFGLPHSRPMPDIGLRCHELRIRDKNKNWRIFYHLASDAVVILDVHNKTTRETPETVLENCRRRLKSYLSVP
jgi:phage-related protein